MFYLLGIIYNANNKDICGYRICNTDNIKVVNNTPYVECHDIGAKAVYQGILNKQIDINGLGLDSKNPGELKGTNGVFEGYPIIIAAKGNNGVTKSLVNTGRNILVGSIGIDGYRIISGEGRVFDLRLNDILVTIPLNRIKDSISNAKVIKRDNMIYLSPKGDGPLPEIPEEKSFLPKEKKDFTKVKVNDKKEIKTEQDKKLNANGINISTVKKMRNRSDIYSPYRPRVITNATRQESMRKVKDPKSGMTVEQKMAYCLLGLQELKPFYYALLAGLKRVEVDQEKTGINTMAVSMDTLFYSPEFVLTTPVDELLFVVMHEVSHVAMAHAAREDDRDHYYWNVACDLYINKTIADEIKVQNPGDSGVLQSALHDKVLYNITLPENVLFNPEVDVKTDTPESIYRELKKQNDDQKQGNGQQGSGQQGSGQQGSGQQGSGQQSENQQENNGQQGSGQQNGQQGGGQQSGNQQGNGQQNGQQSENQQGNNEQQNNGNQQETNGDQSKDGDKQGADGADQQGPDPKRSLEGKEFRGHKLSNTKSDMVQSEKESKLDNAVKQQLARDRIKRAITTARTAGYGNKMFGVGAGNLEGELQKILAPKVDWRRAIKGYVLKKSNKTETNYKAYKRSDITRSQMFHPERRNAPIIIPRPGQKKIDADLTGLKICIDTSGSISTDELNTFASQVMQLTGVRYRSKYHIIAPEVIYWDSRVSAVYQLDKIEDIIKSKPMGGGGTDPNCLFSYFETNKDYSKGIRSKPELVVIFTDGYVPDIADKYSKLRYRVIWVLTTQHNGLFKPGVGKVCTINCDELV